MLRLRPLDHEWKELFSKQLSERNKVGISGAQLLRQLELPQILCHYLYRGGSVPSSRSGTLGAKLREALDQLETIVLKPADQEEDPQCILDAVMFEHRSSLRAKGIKALFFSDNQLQVCVTGDQWCDSEYVRKALRDYNMDRFLEGTIVVKHFYQA